MANGPAPFSEIGKKARDLLTKDYCFDHKFTLSTHSGNGLGIVTTGMKKDEYFQGDINTQYKRGNTTVDVKIDSSSNVLTTVAVNEVLPGTRATLSFKLPDQQSSKLDVQHFRDHAAFTSSIGLSSSPRVELSTAVGSKQLSLGGEVGFDSKSASFTKYNAGIGFNNRDFSASLLLVDKGETLKASYIHLVSPTNGVAVAAEMTHKLTTYENDFTIGSSYLLDPVTMVKARLSLDGKAAILCEHQWRPMSSITLSTEYNPRSLGSATKFGLALALRP